MRVTILYNEPTLNREADDHLAEVGVLDSVRAIEEALRAHGHTTAALGVGGDPLATLASLKTAPEPDVVVNLCEAVHGSSAGEAHLAGVLDILGLPYTGSSPECLGLVRDKARTKLLLQAAGLPTASFVLVGPDESPPTTLPGEGPWIVKPACEDASQGLDQTSVVLDPSGIGGPVERLQRRYGPVLIERYVAGREFNVAVIALPEPRIMPVAEIIFASGPGLVWDIVTYESKWVPGSPGYRATPVECPARIEPELAGKLERAALGAFRATGCRDYARIDLRVGPDGEPMILEVNANPDLAPEAGLARSVGAAGWTYDHLVDRLVHEAARRGRREAGHRVTEVTNSSAPVQGLASPHVPLAGVRELRTEDVSVLVDIVVRCGNFRTDEVDIALEILEETVDQGESSHYQVMVLEVDGVTVAWSAHGLVPMTDATYDLYWIAVDPARQGSGIGKRLLAEVEARIESAGGRWVLAETSGTSDYDATRGFYVKAGYQVVGLIPDFYRAGDSRVTYGKRLRP